MLNRRILRIKAFKTVYSLVENPSLSVSDALLQLEMSCQSTRDLYLFMLGVIPSLTAEASSRIEAARSKFKPTEEELNPNLKFVNNKITPLLANDPDFNRILGKKHLGWDQYDAFLRHLYDSVKESEYFKAYMNSGKESILEDADLWVKIFETEFVDKQELADILEDMSIWWNDDLAYSLSACCRTVDSLASGKPWCLPELYLSQMPGNEAKDSDLEFVTMIIRKAVSGYRNYSKMIDTLTPKWDFDRICTTDVALIVCGAAEADAFPSIDKRIITSEYVEISKFYSTPESRSFVNGVLDKMINTKQQ